MKLPGRPKTINQVVSLPVGSILPSPHQPRRDFNLAELDILAKSIAQNGLLCPITVRKDPEGGNRYFLIAGERRLLACRRLGYEEVPAVIIEADDRKVMELGLIENLQREDLNPAEEARGYRTLMEEYGLTQEQVAQQMGKSRPAITNTLRLLALPDEVLALMEEGTLSAGHARAILGAPSPALQKEAAARVVKEQLSVRQTEALIKTLQKEKREKPKDTAPDLSLYLGELEKDLAGRLGRKVKIAHKGKKGRIELEYYSEQDLETLLELLRRTDGEGVDTYGFF